jgi:3-hydroxybutyryl-CoA dehydrogenase
LKADEITTVAVVGAGTMGSGVAGVFARASCRVRLADKSPALLDAGMEWLRATQKDLVQAKHLSARAAAAALKRIEPVVKIEEACDGVQLLIEAVPEVLTLKREMFAQFDRLCPRRAILATNTSGLSITQISKATRRPGLVAGMHFWNPPHLVPLVEVTKGKGTSDSTARTLMELSRRIGKCPILVRRDVPGFVGNRLQFAVMREALHILSEGIASAEDIDTAMTAGPGLRYALIGPLRTADLGGLDVFNAISEYLFPELNSKSSVPKALTQLVAKGKLGAKSGDGFYKYPGGVRDSIVRRRDRLLLEFQKALNQKRG